jgi:hypothetical protein
MMLHHDLQQFFLLQAQACIAHAAFRIHHLHPLSSIKKPLLA